MKTLICGSLAYDTIMVFEDHFKNHILPEQIHILSVAFLVPEMRREYGGTAGNIAYNLKLLGGEPYIMATVGQDFTPYRERLTGLGLPQNHVLEVDGCYTAQAFITTDQADNQITAFHPGAMNFSHQNRVPGDQGIVLGVIAPDGRDGMFQHAREFHQHKIPFLFDPGQGLPMLNGPEILEFLEMADYLAVNDYEARLICDKTGLEFAQLADMVKAAVITRGGEGSTIYSAGKEIVIPPVAARELVDPTGCGDAYRAGLLYGIVRGWDWAVTGRLASLMGSIKIAHRGGQNHSFTRTELCSLYQQAFGENLVL